MTDQERCLHACLFFAFILLILTIVLFYFAATFKGTDEQRLYYYLGAGICLGFLLLITFCTIIYVRRYYGSSISTTHHRGISSDSDYESSKYSNQPAP
jgi:cytochrome b subunit of formate dehydrogenase